MSRYDRDENPDEIRDSTVRRPAESSSGQHTSDARGQGGGTLHHQPPQREIRAQEQTPSRRNAEPREPNPTRERAYDLRDSQVQTLADIGAFRAIKTEDLVQYRYAGYARQTRRYLKHLVEQGLVQTRTTYTERNVYVGLTRQGRRYIEHSRPANTASRQVFYHGFVKRREGLRRANPPVRFSLNREPEPFERGLPCPPDQQWPNALRAAGDDPKSNHGFMPP